MSLFYWVISESLQGWRVKICAAPFLDKWFIFPSELSFCQQLLYHRVKLQNTEQEKMGFWWFLEDL